MKPIKHVFDFFIVFHLQILLFLCGLGVLSELDLGEFVDELPGVDFFDIDSRLDLVVFEVGDELLDGVGGVSAGCFDVFDALGVGVEGSRHIVNGESDVLDLRDFFAVGDDQGFLFSGIFYEVLEFLSAVHDGAFPLSGERFELRGRLALTPLERFILETRIDGG